MSEENTTYKLERFEVFLISVPRLGRTLASIAGAAVLALAVPLVYWITGDPDVGATLWPVVPAMAVAAVVGGETITWLVPAYSRDWGYFLSLVNQAVATAFLVLAALVPVFGVADAATLAAGCMALNGSQVLIITLSFRAWPRAVLASLPQPATFGATLLGFGLLGDLTLLHVGAVLSAVAVVVVAAWLAELIVAVNVDVRGLDYSSALALDAELDMGIGEPARRPVQWLEITNDSGPARLVAPWFHPGMMSRIGGGRMSREITGHLADVARGSFVKPPVSHKSDPADPASVAEIIDPEPEWDGEPAGTATRMVELDRDGLTFRARRYGESTVVWFDSTEFDDVEMPVHRDVVDPETTLVVDCHAHEPDEARNLLAGTVDAERFRDGLSTILERVDDLPQESYAAGFAAFDDDVPGFAFVERVGDQRTLVLGLDGNNVTGAYRELASELGEEYDRVLLLTTDTHASPFEIDALPAVESAREAVSAAQADCTPASAMLAATHTGSITVLGDAYTKLIDGFNIGARFLIVSLGLSYVFLLVAVVLIAIG